MPFPGGPPDGACLQPRQTPGSNPRPLASLSGGVRDLRTATTRAVVPHVDGPVALGAGRWHHLTNRGYSGPTLLPGGGHEGTGLGGAVALGNVY